MGWRDALRRLFRPPPRLEAGMPEGRVPPSPPISVEPATPAEWPTCGNSYRLLLLLLRTLKERASDRKMRLVGVACCRRIWHLLPEGPGEFNHHAVELAERFADGLACVEELAQAERFFREVSPRNAPPWGDHAFETWVVILPHAYAGLWAAEAAARALGRSSGAEWLAQAELVRDIFGNPFGPPPVIEPSVLAWHDGLVGRLAWAAYDMRMLPAGTLDNGRLAVLADALLDAGCDDGGIIEHLRSPGPHVRGCHAIDACLGRS